VRALLAMATGAEVDTADGAGWTPLRIAKAHGHGAVVAVLRAAGAMEDVCHAEADVDVLRAWHAECRELQELWDESASAITWAGLTFNVDGRVVKIELTQELGDAEDVPAELGGLGALEKLDLGFNRLSSVPAELGGLGALEKLHLGMNQLTSVPEELGGLGALKEFYLHGNQLTSVPAELGGLGALEVLDLYDNKLTSVPAELGGLGAMKVLTLSSNTSVPAELKHLSVRWV
jgi:Leucine-rich repeat (LRR) protein